MVEADEQIKLLIFPFVIDFLLIPSYSRDSGQVHYPETHYHFNIFSFNTEQKDSWQSPCKGEI